jgi:hypothetical protein
MNASTAVHASLSAQTMQFMKVALNGVSLTEHL